MDHYSAICDSQDRDTWLAKRREGIGGSDAPAILGLVPWASPASIQADKWGLLDEPDDAEILRWGRRLERPILEGLAEDTGYTLSPYGILLRSKHWPFMQCTPDALTDDGDPVQIKNTVKASDWQEGPPDYVWVQCQHEMAVTGASAALAAALLLGRQCRWCWIERDDEFIEKTLVPALEEFWRATLEHQPLVDGSEHTRRVLQALYPEDSGETIELDGTYLDLDEELADAKARLRAAQADVRDAENRMRAALKDATYGVLPNGVTYSLKTQHRKEHVVKESTFRVLRRKESR